MRSAKSRNVRLVELPVKPGIRDELHGSQYGFGGKLNEKTGEMSYGFASNLRDALPNASFIGFTDTPIEKTDANTRAVCGGYLQSRASLGEARGLAGRLSWFGGRVNPIAP